MLSTSLGEDAFNPVAGRRVHVNAQMAAVELSSDRDWFAIALPLFILPAISATRRSRTDGRARGFDSISMSFPFAGGVFSFWNREAIRLAGSGRSAHSREPASQHALQQRRRPVQFRQSRIFLVQCRRRFRHHSQTQRFCQCKLLALPTHRATGASLFQLPIRHTIGTDLGIGVQYRPPLCENIVLTGGRSALVPGQDSKKFTPAKRYFRYSRIKFTVLKVGASALSRPAVANEVFRASALEIGREANCRTRRPVTHCTKPRAPEQSPADLRGVRCPLRQSQAEAHRKSAGCITCHTATDEPTMHTTKPYAWAAPTATAAMPKSACPRTPRRIPRNTIRPNNRPILSREIRQSRSSANPTRAYTQWLNEDCKYIRFVNPGDLRVAAKPAAPAAATPRR